MLPERPYGGCFASGSLSPCASRCISICGSRAGSWLSASPVVGGKPAVTFRHYGPDGGVYHEEKFMGE
jgi:hypothetical protein